MKHPDDCTGKEELRKLCLYYVQKIYSLELERKALLTLVPAGITLADLIKIMNEIEERNKK